MEKFPQEDTFSVPGFGVERKYPGGVLACPVVQILRFFICLFLYPDYLFYSRFYNHLYTSQILSPGLWKSG